MAHAPLPAAEFATTLANIVDGWQSSRGISAVVAGVRIHTGDTWVHANGTRPDNEQPATAEDFLDIMSVTKLFTTSLVLRAADQGLIDLYAPVPALTAVPEFGYNELITPMMLLTHRSGLVNYRDTPDYADDPGSVSTPEAAVQASARQPLTMAPGDRVQYSSTNFLVLGLLLEDVTGQPFSEMFESEIVQGFGLAWSVQLPSEPGEPRQATAGLYLTMSDLLLASETVLTNIDGVSANLHQLRVTPEPVVGVGTFGYCPCIEDADGAKTFFGIGYTGGHTWVTYVPSLDLTIGVDVYDDLWSENRFDAVNDLVVLIASAASFVIDG